MVLVKVRPLDVFKKIIGEGEILLELEDGSNILDLLRVLKERYNIYERLLSLIHI